MGVVLSRRRGGNVDKLGWSKRACGILLLWAAMAVALPAQTFTTLLTFNSTDGANPVAGLIQGTDGNLYGTTAFGGADNIGTVYKISTSGTLVTLHSFSGPDGVAPYGALVQGTDGNFYGTT